MKVGSKVGTRDTMRQNEHCIVLGESVKIRKSVVSFQMKWSSNKPCSIGLLRVTSSRPFLLRKRDTIGVLLMESEIVATYISPSMGVKVENIGLELLTEHTNGGLGFHVCYFKRFIYWLEKEMTGHRWEREMEQDKEMATGWIGTWLPVGT